jgi:quercetin dioxygenase-like cupin family protein
MGLKISLEEMQQGKQMPSAKVSGGDLLTFHVYGVDSSMMLATRTPGYHSRPHIHAAEQLNYVIDGEMTIFIVDEIYVMKAGDFLRIPSNTQHWAWVSGDRPCTMLQSFAPVHEKGRAGSVPLFHESESDPDKPGSRSIYPLTDSEIEEIERKASAARSA